MYIFGLCRFLLHLFGSAADEFGVLHVAWPVSRISSTVSPAVEALLGEEFRLLEVTSF